MDKTVIFVDADLDGAGCALIFKWLRVPHILKVSKVDDLKNHIKPYLEDDSFTHIYICDMDTTSIGDIVDHPKVTIFDHHHNTHVYKYQKAKSYIKEYTSCTKLLYSLFKQKLKLTDPQKILIALIDDYDCYKLEYSASLSLNIIFWNITTQRVEKFISMFENGFNGEWTEHQKNMIKIHLKRMSDIINQLEIFYGVIKFGKNQVPYSVVSTTASYAINEVADYILKKTNADIAFIVNLDRHSVCFRKNSNCKVNLGKLAAKIADGGGHEYAAGGKITPMIIEFMKRLQPVGSHV